MKKTITALCALSIALGLVSCDHQGGKMPMKKKDMPMKKKERMHPRRSMLSQQTEQAPAAEKTTTQEM